MRRLYILPIPIFYGIRTAL